MELGVRLRTRAPVTVLGVRFFKSPGNTGTHVGHLWSEEGNLLRHVVFEAETPSGWQQALFDAAISVPAETTLVVSYHAPHGHYAGDDQALADGFDDGGAVYVPADGARGANGVHLYGAGGEFPTNGYRAFNYYVDVILHDGSPPMGPQHLSSPARTSDAVLLTWAPAVGDRGAEYLVFRNGTHIATVPAEATSYTDRTVSAATNYEYSLFAMDGCGNRSEPSRVQVRTLAPTQTILGERAPPGPRANDRRGVELGVKFQSDVPGEVSAVRFYRQEAIASGYTASLWTAEGALLATGRTIEGQGPVPGYQEVHFAPVTIRPGATYVASYFASQGGYSFDAYGLEMAISNVSLTALASGSSGGNGVYRYGSSTSFPTESFKSANYWVDVKFTPAT